MENATGLSSHPQAPTPGERLRQGIALFNRGEFYECHEVLEAAWLDASGGQKMFLQGVIQLAVAFFHLRRGNSAGSSRLMRAAVEKLSGCAGAAPVDLPALLEPLQSLAGRIEAGQIPPDFPAPEIRLLPAP